MLQCDAALKFQRTQLFSHANAFGNVSNEMQTSKAKNEKYGKLLKVKFT